MATRGASGQLFELVREGNRGNTRLGQTFVLFGILSVVGGIGVFVLTETFRFDTGAVWTYRRIGGGLAGYGLPAFLYGLVVASGGDSRAIDVGVVGLLFSVLAVFAFFVTYPVGWDVATSPALVGGTLAVYTIGAMFGAFAAGGAVLSNDGGDGDAGTGTDDEVMLADTTSGTDVGAAETTTVAGTGGEDGSEANAETETDSEAGTGFVWGSPPDG
jgi:hypothetical protein